MSRPSLRVVAQPDHNPAFHRAMQRQLRRLYRDLRVAHGMSPDVARQIITDAAWYGTLRRTRR